jgi:hypothetical protein
LNRPKKRLKPLLAWQNPNEVLKTVIDKVRRQKEYILTFVRFEGVPKTNNFGEYVIKRGILKRKVSVGSTLPKAPWPITTSALPCMRQLNRTSGLPIIGKRCCRESYGWRSTRVPAGVQPCRHQ